MRRVDDFELYLGNMGVKMWITRALDRTEWTSVMRGGKAKLNGL
jgi:hypothetical protein